MGASRPRKLKRELIGLIELSGLIELLGLIELTRHKTNEERERDVVAGARWCCASSVVAVVAVRLSLKAVVALVV